MLLEKVTSALDRAEIPYAVIGASALTVYGVSRATFDLDLLVEVEPGLSKLPSRASSLWTRLLQS